MKKTKLKLFFPVLVFLLFFIFFMFFYVFFFCSVFISQTGMVSCSHKEYYAGKSRSNNKKRRKITQEEKKSRFLNGKLYINCFKLFKCWKLFQIFFMLCILLCLVFFCCCFLEEKLLLLLINIRRNCSCFYRRLQRIILGFFAIFLCLLSLGEFLNSNIKNIKNI